MIDFIQASFASLFRLFSNTMIIFFVARLLGPFDFGVFSFYLSIATLLGIVLDYGYNLGLVKQISESTPDEQPKIIQDFIASKNVMTAIITLGVLLIFSLLFLFSIVTLANTGLFLCLFFSVAANSYINFLTYIFQGERHFGKLTHYTLINNTIFSLLLGFVLLCYPTLSIIGLFFLLSRIIAAMYLFYRFNQSYKIPRLWKIKHHPKIKENIHYLLINVFATAYVQVDTFIVKYYLGYADAGLYQAGMKVALGCMLVIDVINSVFLPKLASTTKKQSPIEAIQMCKKINNYIIMAAILISFVFCLFSKQIILLLYGVHYLSLTVFFPLLCLIIFIRFNGALYGLMTTILNANSLRTMFLILAFIVNIAANFILVPMFHLFGALYAAILTLLCLNACYITYITVKTKQMLFSHTGILLILMFFSFMILYILDWNFYA